MEGGKKIKKDSKAGATTDKKDLPPHCVAGINPGQGVYGFSNIRFFSNFDSGNLLKVSNIQIGSFSQ